jgi:DNA-binding NarL/FixJ family response regulator
VKKSDDDERRGGRTYVGPSDLVLHHATGRDLADDDPVVRYRLGVELKDSVSYRRRGRERDRGDRLAERHKPDAALIGVEMPGGGARAAVPQIAAALRTRAW